MNQKIRKIGVIVEDKSDFDTIKVLASRIPTKSDLVLKKALGKGCGRIQSKCQKMAKNLSSKNCDGLIVIRDLDNQKESYLRQQLAAALKPNPISDHIVIIPVQAIEAWLLSDMAAIKVVFGYRGKQIKAISNTEKIEKPKVYLEDLVNRRMNKRYLNTVHNSRIAEQIDIQKVLTCKSFIPFHSYISKC